MASIHDVARLAQVSIGNVSRVINGRPNVRPATRKAVLAAIAQLGYRPNPLGRNLRRARTTTLAMVVPNLTNQSFVQMISGAEAAAFDRGYTLVLACSHDDPNLEAKEITRMLDLRVDGLLCVPVESEDAVVHLLQEANVPGGVIGGRLTSSTPGRIVGAPLVVGSASSASYEAAFRQVMSDFLGFGHRRIGLVTTSQPFASAERRIATYKTELERAGITYDAALVRIVKTEPEAREALRQMLTLPERVTALICGTLGVAPYTLRAAHDLGMLVPKDLSFVTLGDADWLEAYQPGLNALRIDTHGIAKATTLRLIHLIEGEEADEPFEPTWNYVRRSSVALAQEGVRSSTASA